MTLASLLAALALSGGPVLPCPPPRSAARPAVAIAPLRCQTTAPACEAAVARLARQLRLTGLLRVLDRKHTLTDRYRDWQLLGAAWLVRGRITAAGLDLELHQVERRHRVPLRIGAPVDVSTFVDEVVRYLTGRPGVMGTRIALSGPGGLRAVEPDGFGSTRLPGGVADALSAGPEGSLLAVRGGRAYLDGALLPGPGVAGLAWSRYGALAATREAAVAVLDGRWRPVGPPGSREPTWSPGGEELAFTAPHDGERHLYVARPWAGGEARRLSFAPYRHEEPRWGPAGIACVIVDGGRRDLFVYEPGSGQLMRLTQDQGDNRHPAWSPDGRHLAFVSDRGGREQIWLMTAEGRYPQPVLPAAGVRDLVWLSRSAASGG